MAMEPRRTSRKDGLGRGIGDSATKPFKLVAIDLDGTTVAEIEHSEDGTGIDEKVPPGTVEAAMEYQEAGGCLVIATGRPYSSSYEMARKLGADKHTGYMVCGNGATVHDLKSTEPDQCISGRATLRVETLSDLYRTLLKHVPSLGFGIKQVEDHSYMFNAPKYEGILKLMEDTVDEHAYKNIEKQYTINHITDVEEYAAFLATYPARVLSPDSLIIYCFGMMDEQLNAALEPALTEFKAETGQAMCIVFAEIYRSRAHGTHGGWVTLDDGGGDISNKATGLKVVCEQFGLTAADVLAIGNDSNDIGMFEWAGHSVCMPHANDETKRAASEICVLDFDEGAVAEELRQATERLLAAGDAHCRCTIQ